MFISNEDYIYVEGWLLCVCVGLYEPTSGDNFVFNRISADTHGVGTSPVVKPMPINVSSIFKHIDMVNVIS